jgi:hypothetical protein
MQDGAVSVADHLPLHQSGANPLHQSGANPRKRLQHGGGTPYRPCVSAVGVCHAGSLQGADRVEQQPDKDFRSDKLGKQRNSMGFANFGSVTCLIKDAESFGFMLAHPPSTNRQASLKN